MVKRIILFIGLVSTLSFGYSPNQIHNDIDKLFTMVSDTHEVKINNSVLRVDLRRLLLQTAMIESNFGRDKGYKKGHAKTYMQLEEKSAKWYLSQVPVMRDYIEKELGRKLVWNKDSDAMFVAYLLYLGKLETHPHWIDKFRKTKHFKDGDLEYYLYKIYYNSIAGASTYITFVKREKEYYKMVDKI